MNAPTAAALAQLDAAVSEMFDRIQDLPFGNPPGVWERHHEAWVRLSRAAGRVRLELERPAHRYHCEDCGVEFNTTHRLPPGSPALCGEHASEYRRAG